MDKEYDERYSPEFQRCFSYFWETLVLPTIKLVYDDVDSEFKNAVDFSYTYRDLGLYKKEVMAFYREKREWLKRVYLPHENHPRLDQHKIGALWCRTLLAYKPFYFNYKKAVKYVKKIFGDETENSGSAKSTDHSNWFVANLYANYKVAYLVSTGIVYFYLLYDCKEKKEELDDYLKVGAFEFFQSNSGLIAPPAREGHSDFSSSCIIALEKNDINRRNFDYLTYAIMLYQLEYYNKIQYFLTLNKN